MDPTTRLLTMGAAGSGAAAKNYVEDVFSTWLYEGNGSTQTITNGIDLSGKGGLVWIKGRSGTTGHRLTDTARSATKSLESNSDLAEATESTGLTTFNSTGFALGADSDYNTNGAIYTSWTFRKAAKFFDIVTYTGNGSGSREISHSLGSTPGAILIKRIDTTAAWPFAIRNAAGNFPVSYLNTTAAALAAFSSSFVTSSFFNVGAFQLSGSPIAENNATGGSYVAYIFAHDAGGFGDSENDSIISCGVYTGNGSATGPTVTLGWEPQWLLIKRSDSAGDWQLLDNMRGLVVGGSDSELNPNLSNAESAGTFVTPTATGFQLNTTDAGYNANTGTYAYIAIRRGPMKTPADATAVFQSKVYTGTNVGNRLVTTDIVTDMVWARQRNDSVLGGMVVGDRLRGQPYLLTGTAGLEVDDANSFDAQSVSAVEYGTAFSSMTGFWVGADPTAKLNVNTTASNHVALAFRRAAGFFDIVGYTGTGVARTVSHNLGVVPELILVKNRSDLAGRAWGVYYGTNTTYMNLGGNNAAATDSTYWNNTSPDSSVFTVGTANSTNENADTFIAYLFASCTGVSKVGTYTGTGTTLGVNCGFAAGARFVLIKRVDASGSWFVWDTARGINAGTDPYLALNDTVAEVTANDYIDPLSSGFEISSTAPAAINASGGTFLYLAIA